MASWREIRVCTQQELEKGSHLPCDKTVCIIDASTLGSSLTEYIEDLRIMIKDLTVVVIARDCSLPWSPDLFTKGVMAFLTHDQVLTHLRSAITSAWKGELWMTCSTLQKLFSGVSDHVSTAGRDVNSLSAREKSVAQLIREGLGNKEIACRLSISESTVKFHLAKIFRKCGVTNRWALASASHVFELPEGSPRVRALSGILSVSPDRASTFLQPIPDRIERIVRRRNRKTGASMRCGPDKILALAQYRERKSKTLLIAIANTTLVFNR